MSRVTIKDLEAVLDAVEFMRGSCEYAGEDAEVHKMSADAAPGEKWIRAEIKRRKDRKLVRWAVRQSREILKRKADQ